MKLASTQNILDIYSMFSRGKNPPKNSAKITSWFEIFFMGIHSPYPGIDGTTAKSVIMLLHNEHTSMYFTSYSYPMPTTEPIFKTSCFGNSPGADLTIMSILLVVIVFVCTCYLGVLICYLVRSQRSKKKDKPPPSYSDIFTADEEDPPPNYIDLFPDDTST